MVLYFRRLGICMRVGKTARLLFAAFLLFAPSAAADHCALCAAAKTGDVGELRRLIAEGADIGANHDGRAALFYAMAYFEYDAAEFLIDNGANPNRRKPGTSRPTPFYMAAAGPPSLLRKMLARGGKIEDGHPSQILYEPVRLTRLENVKMLLAAGAEVDKTVIGRSLAARHARTSDGRKIREMLEKSPNGGGLFLRYYVFRSNIAGLKSALDNGVNPDYMDGDGKTALMHAAEEGPSGLTRALLAKNANPNLLDKQGKTALMYAAEGSRLDISRLLLEDGANPDLADRRGNTAWNIIENKYLLRALFRQVLLAKYNLDVDEEEEEEENQ